LLRFDLGRFDDLGKIVRFVVGAPERVLRALVRVCEVFYKEQREKRTLNRSVRRWRGLGELGNLRHSTQKTIAQCVTIRTQKFANMPAKTSAHTHTRTHTHTVTS
jgi:hypothetical protein